MQVGNERIGHENTPAIGECLKTCGISRYMPLPVYITRTTRDIIGQSQAAPINNNAPSPRCDVVQGQTTLFIGFVFPTNLHTAQGVPGVLKLGFIQLDDLKMGERR
jgi:hypothetical protein